jgi:hypothetical protein
MPGRGCKTNSALRVSSLRLAVLVARIFFSHEGSKAVRHEKFTKYYFMVHWNLSRTLRRLGPACFSAHNSNFKEIINKKNGDSMKIGLSGTIVRHTLTGQKTTAPDVSVPRSYV